MTKFITGLLIGVAISLGLAYYFTSHQPHIINKVMGGEIPMGSSKDASNPIILAPSTKYQELANSTNSPNTSEHNNADQNSYDFYSILQNNTLIPNSNSNNTSNNDDKSKQNTSSGANNNTNDNSSNSINNTKNITSLPALEANTNNTLNTNAQTVYYIQVGTYNNVDDANNMKAQLALLGIETHLKSQTTNNTTIHRVYIGPIGNNNEVQALTKQLADNNISSQIIMVNSSLNKQQAH